VNDDLPTHLVRDALQPIDTARLADPDDPGHPPRILLLYGSLRTRSYSRLVAEECARLLEHFGCEPRLFDPSGLPSVDTVEPSHPKVAELRELAIWSEGMVWVSPERHGAMTGLLKTQVDWLPLSDGAVRPTQGKTLAVLEVSGGSQSFNAVNQMRVLGRWMRMVVIPNQSSVPKAFAEFDEVAVVRYLDTPPDADRLRELLSLTGLSPRELLRRKGTPHDDAGDVPRRALLARHGRRGRAARSR